MHFDPFYFSQLRGAQILDAVRLHKNGFPECQLYGEFWRRYRILSENAQVNDQKKTEPGHHQMKAAVEELLNEMDMDKSAYRLGNSQVSVKIIGHVTSLPTLVT